MYVISIRFLSIAHGHATKILRSKEQRKIPRYMGVCQGTEELPIQVEFGGMIRLPSTAVACKVVGIATVGSQ